MTRVEFEQLVKRLESAGASQKKSYRLKVVLLAMVGYGYILTVLGLLLLVLIALLSVLSQGRAVVLKLMIPIGALALTVLRSLWVRWPEPEGIEISKSEAPKLFDEVEAIRLKLRAPRVHRVFLNDAYNAALEQRPRLGIFGWPEGILYVGLPLMHAMSPTEFRAVLAHEMGHLSGNHGRVSGWVYRIRSTWSKLLHQLEQERRWGSFMFTRFLQWYAPFLNAYSFVLARAQEYEADLCAAAIVGEDAAARMLVALNVRGKFLDESFWPGLWKTANDHDSPPNDPYLQQAAALKQRVMAAESAQWVAQSLAARTGYVDTHPSLQDRLAALDAPTSVRQWSLELDRPEGPTAAEGMLGSKADEWYRHLNKRWVSAIRAPWKDRYNEALQERKRLAELQGKGASHPLDAEESWEMATLVARLDGDSAVLPLLEQIVHKDPKHVSANFTLGRILLAQGNSMGLSHLAEAMRGDPNCTSNACGLAEQFLREKGNPDEAERYRQRALDYADLSEAAEKERNDISANDSFSPHELDPEFVTALHEHLKHYAHLGSAYLVRKDVRIFPERPAFVFGIVPHNRWYRPTQNEADLQLFNSILQNAPVPSGTYVILLNSSRKLLRGKLQAVPDSRIYNK